LTTAAFWLAITRMGSAGLLIPVLAITATGLWQSRQRSAVRVWLLAVALAVSLTTVSKLLFMGWGLGIAALDFTGVSGHTLLALSVLPMLFNWLLATDERRISVVGAGFGLILGVAIGVSRVVVGAHSASEVVAAAVVGVLVSRFALKAMEAPIERPWYARLVPLVLLLAFSATTSFHLPTHDWEVQLSLYLSGRSAPFTRQHLTKPGRIGENSANQAVQRENYVVV
jgi:membrane-associated phospholipid phosphatase